MERVFKKAGVKAPGVLIVIIVISVIAVAVYVYKGIGLIMSGTWTALFPVIMYLLMYISIIHYIFDYFRDGVDATIDGMMMRYCALTAASVVIAGSTSTELMTATAVLILVIVPLIREDLHNPKKALVLSVIVLVLSIVSCVAKFEAGWAGVVALADAGAALDAFVGFYDLINPTVQWTLFLVMYIMRGIQVKYQTPPELKRQANVQEAQEKQQVATE